MLCVCLFDVFVEGFFEGIYFLGLMLGSEKGSLVGGNGLLKLVWICVLGGVFGIFYIGIVDGWFYGLYCIKCCLKFWYEFDVGYGKNF